MILSRAVEDIKYSNQLDLLEHVWHRRSKSSTRLIKDKYHCGRNVRTDWCSHVDPNGAYIAAHSGIGPVRIALLILLLSASGTRCAAACRVVLYQSVPRCNVYMHICI